MLKFKELRMKSEPVAEAADPNVAKAVQGLNDLGNKMKGRDQKDIRRIEKLYRSGNSKVFQGAIRALDTDLRDQVKDIFDALGMVKKGVIESVELDEGFSPKEIKMAIGVASDKRYAGGNMSGAVKAIEKIKKGLSDHPQVSAVLKRQNEELEESTAAYAASLNKMAKDKALKQLSKKDRETIAKLAAMMQSANEAVLEGMDNWSVTVVKPVNKLKKGDEVTIKARSAFEAINKAIKSWKDPALKGAPSSHFKIVKV